MCVVLSIVFVFVDCCVSVDVLFLLLLFACCMLRFLVFVCVVLLFAFVRVLS